MQVQIHPLAALAVAEQQMAFDKDQKLLLQQRVFEQDEIIKAQQSRIEELQTMLEGKAE